jgi:hypothetical protein
MTADINLYEIIRSFGYTTSGQSIEIADAIERAVLSAIDSERKDLAMLQRIMDAAPEPVMRPTESWCDEYADWHESTYAAIAASKSSEGAK